MRVQSSGRRVTAKLSIQGVVARHAPLHLCLQSLFEELVSVNGTRQPKTTEKREREREDLQCGDFSVRLLLAGAATFYHLLRVEIRILAFIDIAADGSPRSTEPNTHTHRERVPEHIRGYLNVVKMATKFLQFLKVVHHFVSSPVRKEEGEESTMRSLTFRETYNFFHSTSWLLVRNSSRIRMEVRSPSIIDYGYK